MFQSEIDKLFKGLQKVFGIADDIQIVGHDADGRDHDRILRQVMQMCHQKYKIKKRINAISGAPRYHSWGNNIQRRIKTTPQEVMCIKRNVPYRRKKYHHV